MILQNIGKLLSNLFDRTGLEKDWHDVMDKPLLGRFVFSTGYIEDVYEQGRYDLLMKVPDVHLIEE